MDEDFLERACFLSDDAFSLVTSTSVKQNIPLNEAVSYIIEDWEERQADDEHKTNNIVSDIHQIKCTLAKVDARLSWLEGQIADADIVITKTE